MSTKTNSFEYSEPTLIITVIIFKRKVVFLLLIKSDVEFLDSCCQKHSNVE